jgi:two-component system, LytTR family, response regulator
MTTLRCLIVEDEPFARKGLEKYIRDTSFLELAGKACIAAKAIIFFEKGDIDLIFLDINLPGISGIELLKKIADPPLVIFTTAYHEYALEGFELDAVDYLLKPISFVRFTKAVNKAKELFTVKEQQKLNEPLSREEQDYFFIKVNGDLKKILTGTVLYIQGMGNYITIHTTVNKYVTYLSLKEIEQKLSHLNLIKIHKSYRVVYDKIVSANQSEVKVGNSVLPVSRNYKDDVLKSLSKKLINLK